MTELRKKTLAVLTALSVTASFILASCGGNNNPPAAETTPATTAGTSASETTESTSATTAASSEEQTSGTTETGNEEAQSKELVGSPWVTSVLSGNITAELPDRNDDMYMYYNYDYLKEHQGQYTAELSAHSNEVMNGIVTIIEDEAETSYELEQLRILWSQALDTETLTAQGADELMPYLERVQNVSSISEMNELLTSADFPFSPFLRPIIGSLSSNNANVVLVFPNFLFVDSYLYGSIFYSVYVEQFRYFSGLRGTKNRPLLKSNRRIGTGGSPALTVMTPITGQ